jgi:uncharacterized protein YndB with AHSA1/START domain
MKHTYAMEVDAPIEKVFDLIDNPEKMKLWMDGLEDTIYPPDQQAKTGQGVTFKQRIREGARILEYDGLITEYKKPELLAMNVGDQNFTMRIEYRLTALHPGTRLRYSAEGETHTWYGHVMEALYNWFTKRITDKHMDKLKYLAENQDGIASG